jgi:cytochrome P450
MINVGTDTTVTTAE